MKWTIACPVYGSSYWQQFEEVTLPRFMGCLSRFEDVNWIIHTDRPKEVYRLMGNALLPGNTQPRVIEDMSYASFVQAHREVFSEAKEGDAVVFMCADLIPSKNALHFSRQKFTEGSLAVVLTASRTCPPQPPRVGAVAQELLDFTIRFPHQITRESFFPWGRSALPTQIFFTRDGESIVVRSIHLHPFAVVKKKGVSFSGTVDNDLLDGYPREKIHVVQNGEIAAIEISPKEKTMGVNERPMSVQSIYNCYEERASALHRWYFEHQIRIAGHDTDCGDEYVVSRVKKLWRENHPERLAA